MGELSKLKQVTFVKAYQEKFEELANKTKGLTEEFFISCFLSGLKDEIKAGVQMFQPTTITQAIGLARLQEESIEAIARRSRISPSPKPAISGWPLFPAPSSSTLPKPSFLGGTKPETKPQITPTANINAQPNNPTHSASHNPTFPIKRLTPREMELRKEKGLCYNCDEKYVRGHRCQSRQLYLLVGDDDDPPIAEPWGEVDEDPPFGTDMQI